MVAAAAVEAPWWGVPALAGGFTLFGVAISQIFTLQLERYRAQRENNQRWDTELRQLYARYLVEAKQVRDASVERADGGEIEPSLDDLFQTFEELTLIAPEEVLYAAVEVREAMLNIWREAVQNRQIDDQLFAEYVRTTSALTDAARTSLLARRVGAKLVHFT